MNPDEMRPKEIEQQAVALREVPTAPLEEEGPSDFRRRRNPHGELVLDVPEAEVIRVRLEPVQFAPADEIRELHGAASRAAEGMAVRDPPVRASAARICHDRDRDKHGEGPVREVELGVADEVGRNERRERPEQLSRERVMPIDGLGFAQKAENALEIRPSERRQPLQRYDECHMYTSAGGRNSQLTLFGERRTK